MSKFWKDGTVLAASMTPVLVTILKEMLERPLQSDVVRRTASQVREVATPSRVLTGAAARTDRVLREGPTASTPPPPNGNGNGNGNGSSGDLLEPTPGDVVLTHPRRTYSTTGAGAGGGGGSRFRRVHFKVAIVTGLLAFVIAAVVLTVPELVFGGSVGSSGSRTTLFGGGDSKSQTDQKQDEKSNSDSQDSQPEANPQAPSTEDQAQPEEEAPAEPAPEEPQPAPEQQAPAPSGGTPAPAPAPTTP